MTKYEEGFKAGYAISQTDCKRKQLIKENIRLLDELYLLEAQMIKGSSEMFVHETEFKMPFPFSLFWK
ncbi:hypothetical protein DFQ98_07345 [Salmonella enterica subsp. enterica serovar Essen]|nr:hypothetical protein [Salmonella enterica subsp. enterica serovar Essen]